MALNNNAKQKRWYDKHKKIYVICGECGSEFTGEGSGIPDECSCKTCPSRWKCWPIQALRIEPAYIDWFQSEKKEKKPVQKSSRTSNQ